MPRYTRYALVEIAVSASNAQRADEIAQTLLEKRVIESVFGHEDTDSAEITLAELCKKKRTNR